MNYDEEAIKLIDKWISADYHSSGQKMAALQSMIVTLIMLAVKEEQLKQEIKDVWKT